MIPHTYATDAQTKSSDLAATISAASTPPQITLSISSIESFLHKHTPDQTRWFFSITFPTLICKLFGFDDSPSQPPTSPTGWLDVVAAANDPDLSAKVITLLSPTGVLMSAVSAIDKLSLVKYVFPSERLPEWVRIALQNQRDCHVLADLCPLFKGRLAGDSIKGGSGSFQVQLNVFEYYLFWFAYYPVCKGNSENLDVVRVRRSKRFRLENWACSIPVFSNSSSKRGKEQKNECSLYTRLLYAYLHAFVPSCDLDLSSQSPYRSSLLHYSSGYDASVNEHAEFLVHTLIHFWLVDNDFSPLSVSVCKSFGVSLPLRSILGEMPPTAGLGEVVNMLVKYLNLSLIGGNNRSDQGGWASGSPVQRGLGSVGSKSRDMISGVKPISTWNSWIQRPLYRYILRTFLFCPVETSIKNVSQVFSLWVNYIEPWMISLEEFAELDANLVAGKSFMKEVNQSQPREYSSFWEDFVLSNYLFYSSLVMHFIGFAHKFLHTDPEVIVQMVSKVVSIMTSSNELLVLIKGVDTVYHSAPVGSSRSMLSTLYRFVPSICEQLQDWEDGLSESDADGSFLHENWNKDLRLFGTSEDGGQQLLQLFVLRAESELQSIGGENIVNNLRLLDSLKSQMGSLFGGNILRSTSGSPESRQRENSRNEIFKPRVAGNSHATDIKYKGDWMMRPISGDEVGFLANLLVTLSVWLNERLGLNQRESETTISRDWSYLEVSNDSGNVNGLGETIRLVSRSIFLWVIAVGRETLRFMREHGLRVNLRMFASKRVVILMLGLVMFWVVKRACSGCT